MMAESVWYAIVAGMLAVYVALDGFDFGAGLLHLVVAKNDEERRTVFAAIGPVWDGNEVWFVAAGGVLFFAFPKVYAAGLSGFYLPLMMVVWLFVLRGLGIELRSAIANPLWRAFWDATFSLASGLLALLFGVALGNVIRGVPLEAGGYFAAPLFTDFSPRGAHTGALDTYTILVGLFAVLALAAHGAIYLTWKTEGPVHARSYLLARRLAWGVFLLGVVVTMQTASVAPWLFESLRRRAWSWPLLVIAVASFGAVHLLLAKKRALAAFLASCSFLVTALFAAAAGLFPVLLRSTLDPKASLDAYQSASGTHGLTVGFFWWGPAMILVVAYTGFVFRTFRGKAHAEDHG